MKTSLICGVALAILGGAAPLIAQTRTAPPSTEANYVQTSKVIGTKVKTSQGEEIGVVKDVVLERSNGCLAYTVLSTGGGGARVTGQSKLVAVPWSVFVVSPDASYLTVNVERDRIYNAPVFEYSRISDAAYISNVYSHFSVSAGVSNATMPGATTATTGSTTQTQGGAPVSPTASPGASASVSPGAFAFPSVSASAAPSATASPSASADAKASASPKSRNKGRGESQTSSRHKGEETTQGAGGESTSEATGSSSGNKSSARKSMSEESSAESENTASSKKSSHKKGGSERTSETAPTPGGEQE